MGRIDWSRYAPPGKDAAQEAKYFGGGILCACAVSMQFLVTYRSARGDLYRGSVSPVLIAGAVMPDFRDLLGWSFVGFWLVLLCAALAVGLHVAYHYQEGSRPVYLMRRLPDRWEYVRRCLAVPLTAALCALIAAAAVLAVYYAVYMNFTPEVCLTPDQWKIWRLP